MWSKNVFPFWPFFHFALNVVFCLNISPFKLNGIALFSVSFDFPGRIGRARGWFRRGISRTRRSSWCAPPSSFTTRLASWEMWSWRATSLMSWMPSPASKFPLTQQWRSLLNKCESLSLFYRNFSIISKKKMCCRIFWKLVIFAFEQYSICLHFITHKFNCWYHYFNC